MKFSRNPIAGKLTTLREEAEERDARRRAEIEELPYFPEKNRINREISKRFSEKELRTARAAIIGESAEGLDVAVYSSKIPSTIAFLEKLKEGGKNANVFITSSKKLEETWSQYKETKKDAKEQEEIISEITLDKTKFEKIQEKVKKISDAKTFLGNITDDTATSDVVTHILGTALILGASDIHIEHRTKTSVALRLRIDGILRDITDIPTETSRLVTNRLKLLAALKLNIRNTPQDGRFTIASELGDIEVRLSIIPAEFGEAVVMRVLDPRDIGLRLSDLGLREDDEKIILGELKKPNGMILVTGPTGSGKTTTLYAFLKKKKNPKLKIITIEDPIEYHLEGIEQTQTEPESGYTFVTGLRSILRQDPDVILVGEIRDPETAKAGIDAALTGHLVFSTLHTNNAAGAIPRLIDLDVKPNVIAPALTLVIAQRLVRKLCVSCRKKTEIDKGLEERIKKFIGGLPKRVSRDNIETKLYKAVGCDQCVDGFRGRIAVVELLEIGSALDKLIRDGARESDIQKVATEEQGMVLMQEDGILKSLLGVTTLEEVERATGPISW